MLEQILEFIVGDIDRLVYMYVTPGFLVEDQVALGLNEAGHHLHELYISKRCTVRHCDGLRGAEHISRREAALEQAACATGCDDRGLGSKGHDAIFGEVVEHCSGDSAVRVLNKVDKLMAGEQANAERLDLGRQSVLKGLADEAAPHARLVVKAGYKLLLLSALSTLWTLELNAQVLLEPVNRLGNAVDERLDELGVGNAAVDGLDGVDEVLLVAFVDGANKAQAPGAREKARSAHGLASACDGNGCARACCFDGGAKARNARSNYQYISRFHRIPFSSGALSHE